MIRKKVQLAYITNDSSRKATYKKINKGLKKKMSELSTICGINACAIMYKGQQVLSKFRMILEMEQRKNMVNQESFLSQRTVKVVEQLKKHCKDNQEKEMTLVMFNNICGKWVIHGFNFRDINDLNEKINNIDKRMDAFAMTPLYTQRASSSSSSSMVALPLMTMVMPKAMSRTSTKDIVQPDVNNMDPMKRQQWIMDLMNKNNNNNPKTHVEGDWMMFQFGDNINPNNGH
ncbi:hypothetical protein ES288_D03G130400v1 [Gossypium darwinii]|uniref:MADS-box domain-containing protein n=1 Tax=Gossypium darwinii TaxID=34276 RepID=A0A5D2D7M2_GOSDA|nr:hypothetical protein ES288_D03G130400v1 [Gossypium darwinii]